MTEAEVLALLRKKFDAHALASDVDDFIAPEPPILASVLPAIAKWIHIDGPGFARSDLENMALRCRVLADVLRSVSGKFEELASHATDTDDDE
jgi:hypothetical protein